MANASNAATGFQFHPIDALAFGHCLRNAVAMFRDKAAWTRLQKRGMKQELGWGASSAAYAALYERLTK